MPARDRDGVRHHLVERHLDGDRVHDLVTTGELHEIGDELAEPLGLAGQGAQQLLALISENAIIRPRAWVQPMGSATLQFPYLDVTTVQSAGVTPSLRRRRCISQPRVAQRTLIRIKLSRTPIGHCR